MKNILEIKGKHIGVITDCHVIIHGKKRTANIRILTVLSNINDIILNKGDEITFKHDNKIYKGYFKKIEFDNKSITKNDLFSVLVSVAINEIL